MPDTLPPGADLDTLIGRFTGLGGDAARARHDDFAADLRTLLAVPPAQVPDPAGWVAAIRHGFAYYAWSWDGRGAALIPDVTRAIVAWAAASADLPALLELCDFLYFIGWCFEASNLEQCRLVLPGLAAAARTYPRAARPPPPLRHAQPRVCFLSMFAEARHVMTMAPRLLIDALRDLPGGCEIAMVAWRFAEPSFVEALRAAGVAVTVTAGETAAARLAEVESALAEVAPDILISDMNNGVPLAVFARRAAPVQVFLQAGLPAFPGPGLDAVFDGFGIGARKTGWGRARRLPLQLPWDLEMLAPPPDAAQLEAERAALAGNGPLCGVYGRLVKLTPDYLRAVERILLAVPEARFVAGGTGDPAAIEAFARSSAVGSRLQVQPRFVPGHAWGGLLDLFLDTWPQTGGESVRETMAKGRPVVARHSAEMPAFDAQRDPALLARDWDGFCRIAIRLLRDPALRAEAGRAAAAFARRMADPTRFRAATAEAVAVLLADARHRAAPRGLRVGFYRMFRRGAGPRTASARSPG
jgi:hypothetical protein